MVEKFDDYEIQFSKYIDYLTNVLKWPRYYDIIHKEIIHMETHYGCQRFYS